VSRQSRVRRGLAVNPTAKTVIPIDAASDEALSPIGTEWQRRFRWSQIWNVKGGRVSPDTAHVDAVVPATASAEEISQLTERIRELERQHAAEIERRHRAEEALANTQFELIEARRKATENPPPAAAVAAASPDAEDTRASSDRLPGPATPAYEPPADIAPEMFSTLVSRLSRLREEIDRSAAPSGIDPSGVGADGDGPRGEEPSGLVDGSLRSRLSSAANARSRPAGIVDHQVPPSPGI
jgi:hypothetical protein